MKKTVHTPERMGTVGYCDISIKILAYSDMTFMKTFNRSIFLKTAKKLSPFSFNNDLDPFLASRMILMRCSENRNRIL